MVSLDIYEKLKSEVNQLLSKEENLLDDDEFLLELTARAKDSKSVLGLAKELKEEGNSLYKEKKFEEALESYGYAGVILARHDFQEEECRAGFFDLIICILLNAAACLSKRKEFMQVGQICTIILEFDESNVKAWYRRAVAAVEVGRVDLAYWDLLMANEVDPGNKEVIAKLEEVKRTRLKEDRNQERQDGTPLGLGVGLSPLKKSKQIDGSEIESTVFKRKDECQSSLGYDIKKESEANMCREHGESLDCQNVTECVVKEEVQSFPTMEDKKSETANVCRDKNEDQAEPKCRFVNRKRPGSFISISRKDIQTLMNGKTIQCCNSRSGSRMTIRMVTNSRNGPEKKNQTREEVESDSPSIDDGQPLSSKMTRNQGHEDTVMEDRAHNFTTDQSPFVFKQECSLNEGVYSAGKTSPRRNFKAAKRLKLFHKGVEKNAKVNYGATNFSFSNLFGCRYQSGMKRRDPPEVIHHFRPRKRLTVCCSKFVEHGTSMYVVKYFGTSDQNVCSVDHDLVMG